MLEVGEGRAADLARRPVPEGSFFGLQGNPVVRQIRWSEKEDARGESFVVQDLQFPYPGSMSRLQINQRNTSRIQYHATISGGYRFRHIHQWC